MRRWLGAAGEQTRFYGGCLVQYIGSVVLLHAMLAAVVIALGVVALLIVAVTETPGSPIYAIGHAVDVWLIAGSLVLVGIALFCYTATLAEFAKGARVRSVVLTALGAALVLVVIAGRPPSCSDEEGDYEECIEYWESHRALWEEERAMAERRGYALASAVTLGMLAALVTRPRHDGAKQLPLLSDRSQSRPPSDLPQAFFDPGDPVRDAETGQRLGRVVRASWDVTQDQYVYEIRGATTVYRTGRGVESDDS